MLKSSVLVLIYLVSVVVGVLPTNPSICDAYVPLNAATQTLLLENFADQLGGDLLLGGLARFFDGSIAGTTNFTSDTVKFDILVQHWAQFFGSNLVMNCTDGAFPAFAGNSNLTAVHANLPITVQDFSDYVQLFLNSAAFQSISEEDQEKLRVILFSFRYSICLNQNDPQCNPGSVCDRLCIAGSVSAKTLLTTIIDELVDSLLNSADMAPFFDGSAPGSRNFTDSNNAALLATLKSHLIEFFADATLMGCTDQSIPAYSGVSLGQAHRKLTIGKREVQIFNDIVLKVLENNGLNNNELTEVSNRLNVLGQGVCNQAECSVPPDFPFDDANPASSSTYSVFVLLLVALGLFL